MANRTRAQQVQQAVSAIRAFYQLGRKAPARRHPQVAYGQGVIEEAAGRRHVHPDTLRKARQFAELYSPDDLEALCALCLARQGKMRPNQPVFARAHIIRLVSVASKKERLQLQRQAISNAWSAAQLREEIAKRYGRRCQGGRMRRLPTAQAGLLVQLERMCDTWARWHRQVAPPKEEGSASPAPLDDLPSAVRPQVLKASRAVEHLHAAVVQALEEARAAATRS